MIFSSHRLNISLWAVVAVVVVVFILGPKPADDHGLLVSNIPHSPPLDAYLQHLEYIYTFSLRAQEYYFILKLYYYIYL